MLKVAIIDDGIFQIKLLNNCIIESYDIVDSKIIKIQTSRSNLLSHGTICAYVLERTCNIPFLIDLKILNENKRGLIKDLLTALNWCLQNKVKLINMSIGTLNYHDYLHLKNLIKKLIDNGSILVSAIHNTGLKSFPAFSEGVFAVRQNTSKKLNNGEYGISHILNTPVEKCFVAEFDKVIKISNEHKLKIDKANSYATAVLTGNILSYLKKEPDSDWQGVLSYLIANCKYKEESYEKFLNYSDMFIDPLNIPIIEVNANNTQLVKDLYYIFSEKGYHVEVFTDFIKEPYLIPLDFYCDGKEINKDIIKTCYAIYKPDVIIISFSNIQRPTNKDIWKYIDMSISEMNLQYHIFTNKQIIKVTEKTNLYNEIVKLFY